MNKADFEKYLAHYGAALEKWPASLRHEAEVALRESKELQELRNAEADFETLLRAQPTIDAPAGLAERIIAQAKPRESNGRTWQTIAATLWAPKSMAAAAAVFVMGLMIGWYQPGTAPTNGQVSDDATLQLNNFLNYEEVNLWPEN